MMLKDYIRFVKNKSFQLLLVCIVLLGLYSCRPDKKEVMTIAVASNLQFVIGELVATFTAQNGIECEVIVGSSGKLSAQIVEGAPFDMFLSADVKYPQQLYKNGLTQSPPTIYAFGNLILWSLKPDVDVSLSTLQDAHIDFIAIGNPKTAPYGLAALQVLTHYGVYEELKEKIVFGESISQTNQFIISQAADLGFTSKSVVMSPQMKDQGVWTEIDKNTYDPIAQALVILKNRKKFSDQAQEFKDFILSDEGKKILHKFGYDLESE